MEPVWINRTHCIQYTSLEEFHERNMTCPFHGSAHLPACGYCRRANRISVRVKRHAILKTIVKEFGP